VTGLQDRGPNAPGQRQPALFEKVCRDRHRGDPAWHRRPVAPRVRPL